MEKLSINCPFCSNTSELEIDKKQLSMYKRTGNVLMSFPYMNSFDRELLISGICYSCQERTFNTPAPGNEAAWGEKICECALCGSPIWEKDIQKDSPVNCPCCGYPGEDADEDPLGTPDFK